MLGLSDGERISMIRSTVFDWSTRVTDGQTDGRTDGRAIAYSALSMLSRAKWSRSELEPVDNVKSRSITFHESRSRPLFPAHYKKYDKPTQNSTKLNTMKKYFTLLVSSGLDRYTGWAKKVNPKCSTHNFVKYWPILKKFFNCYNLQKICNAAVINCSTTPQMRRYTALWNVYVRKLACSVWFGA